MAKPHIGEDKGAAFPRLGPEDQRRLAEALINPPKPNGRLARAAKRHARLVERR